jgi:hypothetical protein
VRSGRVRVVLDPMFKQMLVSREYDANVICVEKRHVPIAQRDRWRLHVGAPVWAGRKWSLMAENDDIDVSGSVDPLELALYPFILLLIVGYICVECDDERVAIRKRICRIAF